MKKFLFFTVMVFLIAKAVGLTEEDDVTAKRPSEISSMFARLTAREESERVSAMADIEILRRDIGAYVTEKIRELVKNPDRKYQGALHLVIRSAATHRIENSTQLLVENIDISLDKSTFPVGGRISTSMLYPAAEALVEIGGKDLIVLLIQRIKETNDEQTLRLCGWVLSEHLGRVSSVLVLKGHLVNNQSPQGKLSLIKVIELLQSDKSILVYPLNP